MKNMKKFVAIATALTMVMAPMTAFAATDLEQDGDINYTNTTIYKLTLPTTEGMAFTLDPQGLTALEDEEEGTTVTTNAGKIVAPAPMVAKNQSSVDVKLTAKFYLVDEADQEGAAFVEEITDNDGKQDQKEIAMTITADDDSNTEIKVAGDSEVAATEFEMTKVDYEFVKDDSGNFKYVQVDSEDATELNLQIGGLIAKDYDWKDYTGAEAKKITLHAVFSFTDADGEEVENTVEEPVVEDREPNIPSTATYDASEGTGTIAIDLGAGTTATTVSEAYYGGTADSQTTELEYEVDEEGNLTYSVAAWSTQAGKTKYIKVVLADETSQVVAITIQ